MLRYLGKEKGGEIKMTPNDTFYVNDSFRNSLRIYWPDTISKIVHLSIKKVADLIWGSTC